MADYWFVLGAARTRLRFILAMMLLVAALDLLGVGLVAGFAHTPGGIYVVEDTHTAYWPRYGGDPQPRGQGTSVSYFSGLCDAVNSDQYKDVVVVSDLHRSIGAVHFFE
ncbi:MAG: hypothetical protein HOI95_15765, partial [Chromatiales bacterium]|nr:hypothetical protein [Chromatiales bacterium]